MKKEITVKTASVYDARALAEMVGIANGFSSRIFIIMDDLSINAKSIMGVMSLGLDNGETVTLLADGNDEKAALEGLCGFLTGVA